MTGAPPSGRGAFDRVADYDRELEAGLSATGESKEYYSSGRVARTAELLREVGVRPRKLMDFGCGDGSTLPLLVERLECPRAVGLDASVRALERAAETAAGLDVELVTPADYRPAGDVDLVYSNGVVHHVPPAERPAAFDLVARSLAPGGVLALWENNPGNPGTRLVMRRIPFDRDAVPVWPREARRLVAAAGLAVLRTEFRFFFPRTLARLRPLERRLVSVPLGGQYLVLAQKPA